MEKFNSTLLTTEEEKLNPVNVEALNSLAKLLAAEDLNIIHDASATTASFSPESRTLVLPAWKDLSKVVYLLFTGHEVGHALFTPVGGRKHPKIPAEYTKRSGFQSIINVVEDVRIEKKMKRKYPGLRADFTEGYRRLLKAGFFGRITLDDINASNLVDRLNMAYKCSTNLSGVHFEKGAEKDFFDRGYLLETFEDTVDMAIELYEYMKEEMEDEEEDEDGTDTNPGDTGDGEDGEGEPGESHEYEDSEDEEGEEEGEGSGKGESEEDGEEDGESDSDDGSSDDGGSDDGGDTPDDDGHGGSGDISEGNDSGKDLDKDDDDSDPGSETDEATRSNTEDLVDDAASEKVNLTIPFDRFDHHTVIHETKRVLQDFDKCVVAEAKNYHSNQGDARRAWTAKFYADLHVECMKYVNKCKPVVSYLVKEFEMKKAADEHRRSSTARSGVINVGALHSYKYNEDIFLKKAVVADAKNHGLVMFVDFSGSMHSNMEGTIEQLINLVLFCKKVSIPFEVYGFGNAAISYAVNRSGEGLKNGDLVCSPFTLRKFASNNLSSREYTRALDYLFFMKSRYGNGSSYGYYGECLLNETRYGVTVPAHDQLGSTPLDDAIVAAAGVVKDFRDSNSVQICNVVFLTDGESNPISEYWSSADGDTKSLRTYSSEVTIRDEKTKKSFALNKPGGSRYWSSGMTGFLLSSLAERCGVKIAGFRILAGHTRKAKEELRQFIGGHGSIEMSKRSYTYVQDYVDGLFETLKKDGSASVDIPGYDELFVVRGDSNLKTSEEGILDELDDDAKVADIRKAFKKNSKGKLKTRVMLTKFIDMIA
jgi:hypothetical protein